MSKNPPDGDVFNGFDPNAFIVDVVVDAANGEPPNTEGCVLAAFVGAPPKNDEPSDFGVPPKIEFVAGDGLVKDVELNKLPVCKLLVFGCSGEQILILEKIDSGDVTDSWEFSVANPTDSAVAVVGATAGDIGDKPSDFTIGDIPKAIGFGYNFELFAYDEVTVAEVGAVAVASNDAKEKL